MSFMSGWTLMEMTVCLCLLTGWKKSVSQQCTMQSHIFTSSDHITMTVRWIEDRTHIKILQTGMFTFYQFFNQGLRGIRSTWKVRTDNSYSVLISSPNGDICFTSRPHHAKGNMHPFRAADNLASSDLKNIYIYTNIYVLKLIHKGN